eukprot:1283833-Alexandrium_andersonii.AAC.1
MPAWPTSRPLQEPHPERPARRGRSGCWPVRHRPASALGRPWPASGRRPGTLPPTDRGGRRRLGLAEDRQRSIGQPLAHQRARRE